MPLPRRRRRRSDGENLEGPEDDQDDTDFRIASLERELDKVTMAAAVQAQNNQVMQARIEKMAREMEEAADDEAFEELDELAKRVDDFIEEQRNNQQVLAERIGKMIVRLDSVGGAGRLEDLPRILREEMAGASAGLSPEDLQNLTSQLERSLDALREELDQVLSATQEELSQALSQAASVEQMSQLQGHLGLELDSLRREFEDKVTAVVNQQPEGLSEEAKTALANAVTQAEFEKVVEELGSLKAAVAESNNSGEKALEAMNKLEELNRNSSGWEAKLEELLHRCKAAASEVEVYQDRVEVALKYVNSLDGSSPGTASLSDQDIFVDAGDAQIGFEINDLLGVVVKHGASDLHLKTGQPPTVRLDGELVPVGEQLLTHADCSHLLKTALGKSRIRQLVENKDVEFIYEVPRGRFRTSVFLERGRPNATFKLLMDPPKLESLGLPGAVQRLVNQNIRGLVLVCGPPGSGKSTTLAAIINYLNTTRKLRVFSLEDELRFIHNDHMALVTQREVGQDILDFSSGIKRAVRQDADVIVVGNLVDEMTVRAAMGASAQCLVIAGLEAHKAEKAILKLVNFFPESEKKPQARGLAQMLKGTVSLRAVNASTPDSRRAAEIMVVNGSVAKAIAEGNLAAVNSLISEAEGMQTFEQSMARLRDGGAPAAPSSGTASSSSDSGEASAEPEPQPQPEPAAAADSEEPPPLADEDPIMNWL